MSSDFAPMTHDSGHWNGCGRTWRRVRSDDRSPHGWIEPDPLGHGHVHHVASESIGECVRMAGIGAVLVTPS